MGIKNSGATTPSAINRQLGTAYDDVRIVADNIETVKALGAYLSKGALDKVLENIDEILLADDNAKIAELAAQAAEVSKNAASVSEANAAAAELAAALSEAAAKLAQTGSEASQAAALVSETNAKTSETNAKASEDEAEQWATEPEDQEVTAGKYSSLHYAAKSLASAAEALASENAALASANSAGASAVAAADSETTSENWATYPKGATIPSETEYSSKHYALTSSDEADRAKGYADALSGTPIYQGTWDASGGTLPPNQPPGFTGTQYYIVSVGGSAGGILWNIGDWIIWDSVGSVWDRIGASSVNSVNGQTGVVVIDGTDLEFTSAGTNLISTDLDGAIRELDERAESSIVHVVTGNFTIPTSSLENFEFTILHINTTAPFVITIPDYDTPSSAVIEAFPLTTNTGIGYLTAAGSAVSVAGNIYLPPDDSRGYIRLVTDAQGARSKTWLPSSGRYVGTVFSSNHARTSDFTDVNSTGFTNVQDLLADMTAPAYLGRYLRRDIPASMAARLSLNTTDSVKLPVGTEAERGVNETGSFRFNSDSGDAELYNGIEWTGVGGGGIPEYGIHNSGSVLNIGRGEGYLVDSVTVGSDVTVNLPIDSSGLKVGDWVSVGFYSTAPFKLIVASADHPIMGLNENFEMQTSYAVYTFSYVDATQGWKVVNAVGESEAPQAIMSSLRNLYPAGTDTFTVTYDVGFVDVYINGYLIPTNQYVASTGSEVVLNNPLLVESFVDVRGWNHVQVADVAAKLVQYDNTVSGLAATNVKSAIDEVWVGKPNDNLLINGDMSVWQRGSHLRVIISDAMAADRWRLFTGSNTRMEKSQHTSEGYSQRQVARIYKEANQTLQVTQRIENDGSLSKGGTFTFSGEIRQVITNIPDDILESAVLRYYMEDGTVRDSTGYTFTGNERKLVQGNFSNVNATITIPPVTEVSIPVIALEFVLVFTTTPAYSVDIATMKLERGSVATPFIPDAPQVNISKCKRYYQKSFPVDFNPANGTSTTAFAIRDGVTSLVTNNSDRVASYEFPVEMYRTPSMTRYGNVNGHARYYQVNSGVTYTGAIATTYVSAKGFHIVQNVIDSTWLLVDYHWTAAAEL